MFILTIAIGLCTGCSERITQPTPTAPDTSSNGNGGDNGGGGGNGGSGDYGQLYFSSGQGTIWLTEGPVTLSDGNIIAENRTETEATGNCTLLEAIDFGRSINMTFTWRESRSSGAEYHFFISDNLDRWQELPYRDDENGLKVAQFEFILTVLIHCRFEFILPPSAAVQITEIKGYGY